MCNMKLTPEKLTAFCAALSETCNVGRACKAVEISRVTAYKWRNEVPGFSEAWDEAMRVGVSALEDEAHRRAFEGVDKPLSYQGQFTYLWRDKRDAEGNVVRDEDGLPVREPILDEHGNQRVAAVREYSDTLAIFLLKAHNPDKYRDNSKVELSGVLELNNMSDDEIKAELAALTTAGLLPKPSDDFSDLVG